MDESHVASSRKHKPELPDASERPKKSQRKKNEISCDSCRIREIHCTPDQGGERCLGCSKRGIDCSLYLPVERNDNRTALSTDTGSPEIDREEDARIQLELLDVSQANGHGTRGSNAEDPSHFPGKWKDFLWSNGLGIKQLIAVYIEAFYPVLPLFHIPSLKRRATSRDYIKDRAFFACIMALCALASNRAKERALYPERRLPGQFRLYSPEYFFSAAQEVIPQDSGSMTSLDWMRTCSLLAVYGIQVGKKHIMHKYLGMYHGLIHMNGLYDEKIWPEDIGIVETELRRRLFWSTYALVVYTSVFCGHPIPFREAQCSVNFPSEIDDELFSDDGYLTMETQKLSLAPQPQMVCNPGCWLHGWNFTIVLYRRIETVLNDYYRENPRNSKPSPSTPRKSDLTRSYDEILEEITRIHENIPPRFKEAASITPNGYADMDYKFSFLAANIKATFQLARMIIYTAKDEMVELKCSVAYELLESFEDIPLFFLQANSCLLVSHFASIGAILSTSVKSDITRSSYEQIRGVLTKMKDFIDSAEKQITRNMVAVNRFREQITLIDEFMRLRVTSYKTTYPDENLTQAYTPTVEDQLIHSIDQNLQSVVPAVTSGAQVEAFASHAEPFSFHDPLNGLQWRMDDANGAHSMHWPHSIDEPQGINELNELYNDAFHRQNEVYGTDGLDGIYGQTGANEMMNGIQGPGTISGVNVVNGMTEPNGDARDNVPNGDNRANETNGINGYL